MERIIKTVTGKFKQETLDFVEEVFTNYANEAEAKLVRASIDGRNQRQNNYVPELDFQISFGR